MKVSQPHICFLLEQNVVLERNREEEKLLEILPPGEFGDLYVFCGKLKLEINLFYHLFFSAAVASGQLGRVDIHSFLFNLQSQHRKTLSWKVAETLPLLVFINVQIVYGAVSCTHSSHSLHKTLHLIPIILERTIHLVGVTWAPRVKLVSLICRIAFSFH